MDLLDDITKVIIRRAKDDRLTMRMVCKKWCAMVERVFDDNLSLLKSIESGDIIATMVKLRNPRNCDKRDLAWAIRRSQKYGLTKWYLENMSLRKFDHIEWMKPLFWTITQNKLCLLSLFAQYGYYHPNCTLRFVTEHDLIDVTPPMPWNVADCVSALVYAIMYSDRAHWRDILLTRLHLCAGQSLTTMQFTSVFDADPEVAVSIAAHLSDVDAWLLYRMTGDSNMYFTQEIWYRLEPVIMSKVARYEIMTRESRPKSLLGKLKSSLHN